MHLVVYVGPLGVVVHFLNDIRCLYHPSHGIAKAFEGKGFLQGIV
jgi:hypothetical protein